MASRIRLEIKGKDVEFSFGLDGTKLSADDIKKIALAIEETVSSEMLRIIHSQPIELCINSGDRHYDVFIR